jgi:hypothetical protein
MELTIGGSGNRYEVNVVPDECPVCHHRIEPIPVAERVVDRGRGNHVMLNVLCMCPRRACERGFLAFYMRDMDNTGKAAGSYKLRSLSPNTPSAPDVSEEVKKISPAYVEILKQAAAAESYELDEIAGVGYRKALEFLIKDYCVSRDAENAENIKASFLGQCIEKYVQDANVKKCAKLAAWLGNDETHYVRRWEEKDLKDLKKLMKLTEAWIMNVELTEQYVRDMTEGR